jgi:DNA-binding beta-propeller fold protein YncE
VLRPDVSKYLAKVSSATLEPPAVTGALACDFTFVDGAPMTVVHLLAGASLRELIETRAYDQVNGYETETVPHLGKAAFSIARNHKPRGLMALSGSDVCYAVMGQFSFAKDIALIKALFQLEVSEHGSAPRAAATPMQGEALTGDGLAGNALIVVHLATGQQESINVGIPPEEVLASPDGKQAYTFSLDDSFAVPVNLVTRRAEARIELPGPWDGAALSPDGRWLYVTTGAHTFGFMDPRTGRLAAKLNVPGGVGDIVENPAGTMAYVDATSYIVEKYPGVSAGGDDVSAIDLVHRRVSHVFVLAGTSGVFAVSNDGKTLYTTAMLNSTAQPESKFYKINLVSGAIGPGEVMGTNAASPFVLSPQGQAYATTDEYHMVAYNLGSLSVTGKPFYVGEDPAAAVFSDGGRYMAVATEGGIVVVDLSDRHAYPSVPIYDSMTLALVPGTFRP